MIIRINLLPEKKKIEIPKIPILPFIYVALLALLGWFLFIQMANQLNAELERLNQEVNKQMALKKKAIGRSNELLEAKTRDIQYVTDKLVLIQKLTGENVLPWSTTFMDLTVVVPFKTVWLKSFSYEPTQRLSLLGVAIPKEEDEEGSPIPEEERRFFEPIEEFINKLEEHANFSDVYLSSATQGKQENQDVVNFSLTCKINKGSGVFNE